MSSLRRLVPVFAGVVLLSQAASAQTIRGSAVLRSDSSGVPGVVVLLLDDAGEIRLRALTDDRGRFSMKVIPAARYRLRAMRIGLRSLTTDAFVAANDTSLVLAMTDAPTTLPPATTRERTECNLRPDSALALGALWEDAKTALLAAAITREKSAYRFDLVDHTRTFQIGTGELRSVRLREAQVYDNRTWSTISPEQLRREGYVIVDDDSTLFVAPDVETLVSDYFIDTHCFRLASAISDTLLAIQFSPARNFGHAEVHGMLWVDKRTHDLRRVDFGYTNLVAADSLAGGYIELARLATGGWVLTDWSIRAPMLQVTTERYVSEPALGPRRRGANRAMIPSVYTSHKLFAEQMRVTGGTLRAVWRDTTLIWSPPPKALDVKVTTGYARTAPSADETIVYLVGTGKYAYADSLGTARFPGLVHGSYLVEVGTRQLDVLGWPRAAARIDLERAATELAEVNVARPLDAARAVCGDEGKLLDDRTGVVIGAVTRGSEAVGHLDVTLTWADSVSGSPHPLLQTRTVRTLSGDGRFLACGVPRNRPINIRVDGTTKTTTMRLAATQVVGIVDLPLTP